ncbi:unnamed protein product [Calicophoron daubneyi]|uniref:Beta-1,3-galactosyl-O-glycosyl-glycoprotein beta-1,6-N-acetylglucosaminyltransferase n=1 Tax=Calicophoron daubneyi TaxID=300641 RepID=A0AAV2TCL4_CALDB
MFRKIAHGALRTVTENNVWKRVLIIVFLVGIALMCYLHSLFHCAHVQWALPLVVQHNKSSTDCIGTIGQLIQIYQYAVHPEEEDFLLAFSILLHEDLSRAIRLISAIYRPHNYYCIHVDRKTPVDYLLALQNVTDCLGSNIYFVPDEQRVNVQWGTLSVLEPELICARYLLNAHKKWKYWINLTGQEFPLRTNLELVRALQAFDGINLVERIYNRRNLERFPPSNYLNFSITWFKGSVHVALRREFVNYMLNNEKTKAILDALRRYEHDAKQSIVVDETFFATLNNNPSVIPIPGAIEHMPEEHPGGFITRAKIWQDQHYPCGSGHWQRTICIFGVKDLPFLLQQPHFFANKFIPSVEPLAYDVLESWLGSKVRHEKLVGTLHPSFNSSYYRWLSSTWTHL